MTAKPTLADREFHIAFFTDSKKTKDSTPIPRGWIKSVKVTIEYDLLPPEKGDLAERYRVDLADHPLYVDLVRYVKGNPR